VNKLGLNPVSFPGNGTNVPIETGMIQSNVHFNPTHFDSEN